MCGPAAIPIVIAAVGAAGSIMSASSGKQEGEFQNDVAKFNARQMENEAVQTRNKGTEEEIRQREKTAQLTSLQRAQLGAAGVDVGSGSALALQQDTETLGEADALRIRSNFGQAATSLESQADIERAQGKAAKQAGINAFRTSLLTGSSSVASKWYAGSRTGSSLGGGSGSSSFSSTNAATA